MIEDARARAEWSAGLALIEKGIQRMRIGVEIERTLKDESEPDGARTPPPGSRVQDSWVGDARPHANGN